MTAIARTQGKLQVTKKPKSTPKLWVLHQEALDSGHCHIGLVIIEDRMFSEFVWIPKTITHLQPEDVLLTVPKI